MKKEIPATLIQSLQDIGYYVNLPKEYTKEEMIIQILAQIEKRLLGALPLVLEEPFDYEKIADKLKNIGTGKHKGEFLKDFHRFIFITKEILKRENINYLHLEEIIKKYNLKKEDIKKEDIDYFHDLFLEAKRKREKQEEQQTIKDTGTREKLNLNDSLSILFSPGKIRIMEKIYNHEELTNTELKYYYRSIRPIIKAINHPNIKEYLHLIENTKKITGNPIKPEVKQTLNRKLNIN